MIIAEITDPESSDRIDLEYVGEERLAIIGTKARQTRISRQGITILIGYLEDLARRMPA